MNQLRIAKELKKIHDQLDFYRRLNAETLDDKVAQGATFAYSSACRHLDALLIAQTGWAQSMKIG